MSFFIDNCCLKLNYLVCGSNESSSEKKTKKFKSRVSLIDSYSREISSHIQKKKSYNHRSWLNHMRQPMICFITWNVAETKGSYSIIDRHIDWKVLFFLGILDHVLRETYLKLKKKNSIINWLLRKNTWLCHRNKIASR